MAQDWFVRFKGKPNGKQVRTFIRDFFSDIGIKLERRKDFKGDSFVIWLPGKQRNWYRSVLPAAKFTLDTKRFIQVIVWEKGGIDITTRLADEFTNCLAARLADMFKRHYKGTVTEPG